MSGPLTFEQVDVLYKECKRNHAASLGYNSVDGCQEFFPAGSDGTREAMVCDACACHRNFHRKVVVYNPVPISPNSANAAPSPSPPPPPPPFGSPVRIINGSSSNNDADAETAPPRRRTRTRTKTIFTAEQRAQLVSFAQRLEWKTRNASDDEVDRFCKNLGITRKMFRDWMSNNRRLKTAGTA